MANLQSARILHLSGDYPDTYEAFKTPVIRTLVELTRDRFHHEVLSINRRSPGVAGMIGAILRGGGTPALTMEQQPFPDGIAVRYRAPGRGIFHATMLRQLGERLAEPFLNPTADRPGVDLIVGHKLAIEGIAVRRMAEMLRLPYAISIQGDTDTKILQMRPDLASELGRVFHGAEVVFPFAPWAMERIEQRLGKRSGTTIPLPCPTGLDQPIAPRVAGTKEMLTVFHLKNRKRKNLAGMVAAMRIVAQQDPAVRLSVIGGGSEDDFAESRAIINGQPNVHLVGPLDHSQLRDRFNSASGFVMPSLRESFGLVFVEALFSGAPIIYPQGTSVDGFFDGAAFAHPVSADSAEAIARAIMDVVNNEQAEKAALTAWQTSEACKRFTRPHIARTFAAGLNSALG